MYEPNVQRILDQLSPSDIVLDIGGWARPFNRANFVLDAEPYATRGYYGSLRSAQGGSEEKFSEATWIQRDMCEHTPFPFGDKEVDFVTCSHVLEDIRDPLWVCSEMIRVAKRGYIEVPSRMAESSRGTETGQVGWSHHRWLIDIERNSVQFLMKYHRIHSHWRLSFPQSYLRRMSEANRVQWLFWDASFEYSEGTIHGVDNIEAELAGYVRRVRPYPQWMVAADRALHRATSVARRVVRRLGA